jgi:hypothetical protein
VASHALQRVRSVQIAATQTRWNGTITNAFAVRAAPPPSHVSKANSPTAPGGYSECG